MGEVYRARDQRLERDVAVKVLPPEVAADLDRLERFEREAKTLAKLSHPNILPIFEFGNEQGVAYAVTELLEGATLRQWMKDGARPWREAATLGAAIADGLAAAHAQGIVHRDLKPENVIVVAGGGVKILDFGLARVAACSTDEDDTISFAEGATVPGTVLGTVGYMAPEQVRGETADHRAEIFAFGCVMYEMLAGERAFSGTSGADTLSAILTSTPSPLVERGAAVPAGLSAIVERCLQKDPQSRFQSASDLAFAPRSVVGAGSSVRPQEAVAERKRSVPWPVLLAVGLVAVALGLLAMIRLWRSPVAPQSPPARLAIDLPQGIAVLPFPTVAVSPGGRRFVFVVSSGGTQKLVWRQIDDYEVREIPGSEGAWSPFFSPDGEWVAFGVPNEGKLKKVALRGGMPQTVCTCPAITGSWGEDGTIVFGGSPWAVLSRVSADGGEPEPLTDPDRNFEPDETYHLYPQLLPGGRAVLFTATDSTQEGRVVLLTLGSGERRTLIDRGTSAHYVASGHIVYALPAQGDLMAVPFDLESLQATGDPVPVLAGVRTTSLGAAYYDVSRSGTLTWVAGPQVARRRLAWVDLEGRVQTMAFAPANYMSPRVAPNGSKLAVTISSEGASVFLLDPARETVRRLTDDQGTEFWLVWSPNGQGVVYNSFRLTVGPWKANLYSKSVGGRRGEVLLYEGRLGLGAGWTGAAVPRELRS